MQLNSRSSLDPRWVTHFQPVVAGFFLATIKVIRNDPTAVKTYDPTTKTWSGSFITVFTGQARVQPIANLRDRTVGQDPIARQTIRVQFSEKNSGINLGDVLIVTACPNNPELTKFEHDVRSTIGSSNEWGTTLLCETNMQHSA